MPCLYLNNTFRQRQTLKTLKAARRKQRKAAKLASKEQKLTAKLSQKEQKVAAALALKEQKAAASLAKKEQKFLRAEELRAQKLSAKAQKAAQAKAQREQKLAAQLAKREQEAQKLIEAKRQREQRKAAKLALRTQKRDAKLAKQQAHLAQAHQAQPKHAPTVIEPKYQLTPSKIPEETFYVPHPRKRLSDTATVSQTLTAAISSRMVSAPIRPAPAPATPAQAPILQAKQLLTNIVNMQPLVIKPPKPGSSRADLINAESRLGSRIFGPIPYGHRREFFHDRQNVWIWHEDWQDEAQNLHQMTVRYEVLTSGVYKKISTGKYFRLEGDELENFLQATKTYLYLIKKYLYQPQSRQA